MRYVKDKRGFYRTERPAASPVTYGLMFMMAFLAGAACGVVLGFRFTFNFRRNEAALPATPENIRDAYLLLGVWGIAGGIMGMITLFALLREK